MSVRWRTGNRVELLENGEELFPRALHAIETARHEVLLETFILEDDEVGRAFLDALTAAAARGVRVELTADAWGSAWLQSGLIGEFTAGGVCVHRYGAAPAWRQRIAWFRRLHRKLIVVDGRRAFVGGINLIDDQMVTHRTAPKEDFAVQVRGPLVADIHKAALDTVAAAHRRRRAARPPAPAPAGGMRAAFVTRDNRRQRDAIERQYRVAVARARARVLIANPYFFPGYRLLRGLVRAAERGVDVRLILQDDQPDMAIARLAAIQLYDHLLAGGVRIFEYRRRGLHAKVAAIDGEWATVGSSNLDPLSLAFNLEANVIVRDAGFGRVLTDRLDTMIRDDCTEVDGRAHVRSSRLRALRTTAAFHVLRHFPRWAGWLPAHHPIITRESPARAGSPPRRPPDHPR